MNTIIRYIQTYLIAGLPFVIACVAISVFYPGMEITKRWALHMLGNVLTWNLVLWFACLILFLITLLVIPSVREKTLRRLANIRERDEREEYITGKASRAAYISTLSLMIFFLFFSVFSLKFAFLPKEPVGHRYTLSISLKFPLLNNDEKKEIVADKQVIFDSKNLGLSDSTIILILLSWQLLMFNLAARKERIFM